MSDQVHASPQDIRRLAVALGSFKEEVSAASKRVQGALRAANWHDQRKTQFEVRYQDLQKQIDRFMAAEVDQMVKALNHYASKLEEIKNIRL